MNSKEPVGSTFGPASSISMTHASIPHPPPTTGTVTVGMTTTRAQASVDGSISIDPLIPNLPPSTTITTTTATTSTIATSQNSSSSSTTSTRSQTTPLLAEQPTTSADNKTQLPRDANSTSNAGINAWIFAVIAAAVALLLVAAIIVFVRHSKQRKFQQEDSSLRDGHTNVVMHPNPSYGGNELTNNPLYMSSQMEHTEREPLSNPSYEELVPPNHMHTHIPSPPSVVEHSTTHLYTSMSLNGPLSQV